MDFNDIDDEGNTLPHLYLLEEDHDVEGVSFFLEHGTKLIRNYKGESVLHFAVRYSPFILQLVKKLYEHNASVCEINDQGSSVLHEVLKNPFVSLEVIRSLLEYGAPPDYCDNTGKPPLAYCECSSLQPDEKLRAEKMLIQYSIGKKIYELSSDYFEKEVRSIFCFHFVKESEKLKVWTEIRDSCIFEILKMRSVHLEKSYKYSVFDLLIQHFHFLQFQENIRYPEKDDLIVIFAELRRYEYPNFKDLLFHELEVHPLLLCFVEKIKWYSTNKIMLTTDCVKKICSYLSKRELLNLLLV